jgi:hypothetical protein
MNVDKRRCKNNNKLLSVFIRVHLWTKWFFTL